MQLVKPEMHHLEDYCAALSRGWSANNLRPEAAQEQLAAVANDAEQFLASLEDPQAKGGPVKLPDGSYVPRLPSLQRWIWDGGFCGSIGLRWSADGAPLAPTASGHVGYAVVPWRRREGLATKALLAILPLAYDRGLTHVDVTVDPENAASIGVITKAGGTMIARYDKHPSLGTGEELLYRVTMPEPLKTP